MKYKQYYLKFVYTIVLLVFAAHTAQANPNGATVVNGQANLATSGNTLTVINTPGTIINWQGFSIGANEITRFVQQNASSAVLNRVTGNNPSNILGTLQSNGRVFLINPNGIVFGAGATVDVAGLVASTLNLSNADFLAGRYNFTEVPGAQNLSNAGTVTAHDGGQIYLIAPDVENTGVITSPNGEILLAAGYSVDLVNTNSPNLIVNITAPAGNVTNVGQLIASSGNLGLFGTVVRNSGIVSANSATMEGGKIIFKASQRTEISGAVTANGITGGTIHALGNEVGIMDGATVSANGAQGGGTVLVGGDYQGNNPDVQNAQVTYVAPTATVSADATDNGNGGKLIVWADNTTRAYGSLSARGGINGGNGGFIETSGHYLDVAGIRINTAALNGLSGAWLLDPWTVTIASTPTLETGGVFTSGIWTPSATGSTILNTTIESALNVGTAVTITTTGAGFEAGDIIVSAPITMTGATPTTLTLQAANSIFINQPISSTNITPTALNLVLDHGAAGSAMLASTLALAGGNLDVQSSGVTGTGTLNVSAGATSLTGMLMASALNMSGGGLILAGIAPTNLASVTMSDGMLSNESVLMMGSLTFNPALYSSPSLNGFGDKIVTGNTSFAPQASNWMPWLYIYNGALITQGTTSYTPPALYPATSITAYLNNGASINNTGTWVMNGISISGIGSFTNTGAGVVNVSGGGGNFNGVSFNNNSSAPTGVNVAAGSVLTMDWGGSSSGTFDLAAGGNLRFGMGTHTLTGAITGTGNIEFSNGTSSISGSVTAANLSGTSSFAAATLSGTTNIGSIVNIGATINLTGTGPTGLTNVLSNAGSLSIDGSNGALSSLVNNGGSINLNEGTIPIVLTVFDVNGGVTNIASNVSVPTMNWAGGEVGGPGVLNVTSALNLNPPIKSDVTLNAKQLNVLGTTTQGVLGGAEMVLFLTNGAVITNTGAWTMNKATVVDLGPTPNTFFNNSTGGSVSVPVGGFGRIDGVSFVASGGTTSGMLSVGTMMVNTPTSLTGLTINQSLINNSTVTVGAGTTDIYGHVINNSLFDIQPGGTVNTNGRFDNTGTGTLAVAGVLNTAMGLGNDGVINLNGGTLNNYVKNNSVINSSGGTLNGTVNNASAAQINVTGALILMGPLDNFGVLSVKNNSTLSIASVGSLNNAAGGLVNLGDATSTGNIASTLSTINNAGTIISNAPVASSNTITGSLSNTGSINVVGGANLVIIGSPTTIFDSAMGALDVMAGSALRVQGGSVTLGSGTVMGFGGGVVNLNDNSGANSVVLSLLDFINPVDTQTHLTFTSSNQTTGVVVYGPGALINNGTLDITNVSFMSSASVVNYGVLTFAGAQSISNFSQNDGASLTGTGIGAASNVFDAMLSNLTFSGTSALNNLTLNAGLTAVQGVPGAPAVINMQAGAVINNSGAWGMNGTIQDLATVPDTFFNNIIGGNVNVPVSGSGIIFGTSFAGAGGSVTGALTTGVYINPALTTFDLTANQVSITGSLINEGTVNMTTGGNIPGNLVNKYLLNVDGTLIVGGTFTNSTGAITNLNASSTLNVAMGATNNGTVNASTGTMLGSGSMVPFVNQSVFNINSSLALPAVIATPFDNNGTVNVNSGAFDVIGSSGGTGSFVLTAGTALNFGGGAAYTGATAIAGAGDVTLGGVWNYLFSGSVTANSLTLGAGPSWVQINGALTVPVININGGSILQTYGAVANLATLTLNGGTLNNSQAITASTLHAFNGTILGLGGVSVMTTLDMAPPGSYLYLAGVLGGTILTNNGTATLGVGAYIGGAAGNTFNNSGTLNVTGVSAGIDSYFNNTGTVNVASAASLTLSGSVDSTTPINLASGAVLNFGFYNGGGIYNMSVAGAGDIVLSSSGNTTINGAITANSLSTIMCDCSAHNYIINGAVSVATLTADSDPLILNGPLTATTANITSWGTLILNSNVVGSPNTIADLTNDGLLDGTGNLNVTNSIQVTGFIGSTFTDINITHAVGNITAFDLNATNSIALAATTGVLTIGGAISAPTISAIGGTGLILDSLASFAASAPGNAIVLSAGTGNFVNNAGASALTLTGGGNWLVYSSSPLLDTRGGLVYDFKQYNTAFGGTILGTGNGFVYTLAPIVTFGLTGTPSKIYDGTTAVSLLAANFSAATGGIIDGDVVITPVSAAGVYDTANVGAGKLVTATGSASATNGVATVYGYQYSASGAVGTITPAILTYTANAANRLYGGIDPAFSGTVSGFVPGETLATATTGTASFTTTALSTSIVGSYDITGSGLTANNGNYIFAQSSGNATAFTITPASLTVTANNFIKTYDAVAYTGGNGVTYTGFVNGETSAVLGGALIYGGSSQGAVNAGNYIITPGGLTSSNYTIGYVDGTLTINPATLALLSVTANNASKTYGTTLTFAGTEFTPVGLIGGDTISGVTLTSAGAVNTANAGAYAITPSNAVFSVGSASNYDITYVNGTLTVNPAPLTITADLQSKIYGNTDPALTYVATGLLFSDALTGGLGRAAGENVGTYAITQGSLGNPNYAVSYTGNTLSITPRSITVAVNAASKTYGSADNLTVGVGGSGLAAWDTTSTAFTGSLSRTAGENVGTYAINQGTLAANANYTVTGFTGNNLTITQALLTVYAKPVSKVLNTTDPQLTYTVSGLQFNDTDATTLSGALIRDPGETVGNYKINQGSLTLIDANYTMSYVPATFIILLPTVINEMTNTTLLLGTPDTGGAQSTGTTEEEKQKTVEVVAVADTATSADTTAQPLPVCQ